MTRKAEVAHDDKDTAEVHEKCMLTCEEARL